MAKSSVAEFSAVTRQCALCLVALTVIACSAAPIRVLQLTDIHFDPQYSSDQRPRSFCRRTGSAHDVFNSTLVSSEPSLGQYGCDAPEKLVRSALAAAAAMLPAPDVVLLSGDLAAHKSPSANSTRSAMISVMSMFQEYFPATPIVPVIGNDDLFPDYTMAPGMSRQLDELGDIFAAVLGSEERHQFSACGFYQTTVNDLHIVVLNTILYSRKYVTETYSERPFPPYTWESTEEAAQHDGGDDPCGQLAWLTQALDKIRAAGHSSLLVVHIPPGYGILPNGSNIDSRLWHDGYVRSFLDVVSSFADGTIAAIISGHLHTDVFRLLGADAGAPDAPGLSVLSGPSVSPVDGNNPGFRLLEFDRVTAVPLDWSDYFLDLESHSPSWERLYTFSELYSGVAERPDVNALKAVTAAIREDDRMFSSYLRNVYGATLETVDNHVRYVCAP